ncbi:MAG TPA: hypothetical protein VGM91_02265 [Conexibacter sp.]|jgi:hypothetical protein
MAQHLQLVFSDPGDTISDEEFDRWYEEHLDEILSIPGFLSAQRYALDPVTLDGDSAPFRRLVVYEVDADTERLMRSMQERKLDEVDNYRERKDAGDDGPALPRWWSDVRFSSWNCAPIGERVLTGRG